MQLQPWALHFFVAAVQAESPVELCKLKKLKVPQRRNANSSKDSMGSEWDSATKQQETCFHRSELAWIMDLAFRNREQPMSNKWKFSCWHSFCTPHSCKAGVPAICPFYVSWCFSEPTSKDHTQWPSNIVWVIQPPTAERLEKQLYFVDVQSQS